MRNLKEMDIITYEKVVNLWWNFRFSSFDQVALSRPAIENDNELEGVNFVYTLSDDVMESIFFPCRVNKNCGL